MNKKYIHVAIGVGLASSLLLASCTKPFAEVNTNPYKPTKEMLQRDGIHNGTYLPNLQFAPVPTGIGGTGFVNNYQILVNLTMDNWAGYMAPRDNKWTGRSLTQFYFDTGWTNMLFNVDISTIYGPWLSIKQLNYDVEAKNLEIWHIAQITKIMGLHRTTDKFGAIPYFNVGSGSFTVAYDSQEEVYKSFFTELSEAVDHLYRYSQINGIVPRASDLVYSGDAGKWAKLGNSLMLRLAMRVRYVDPALSQQWAEHAIQHPAGMIESLDEIAMLSDREGTRTRNALSTIAGSYNDARMGASIYVYLRGYQDPRLTKYFTGTTDFAVPPAIGQTDKDYDDAAKPLVDEFSPTYWFKSSETAFLKAEAALAGYNAGGTAQSFYEEGVRRSFAENNISAGLARTYLMRTTPPSNYVDRVHPKYNAAAPSSITVRWDPNATEEQNLERIMVQKYLAIFPDGLEAWTEWRRTGYPRLIPPNTNISNFGVITSDGHKDGVRSIPYPDDELQKNATNVRDAINNYRGGSNNASVHVWWDVKVKN